MTSIWTSRLKINFGINIPPVTLRIPTFHFPPIKLTAIIHPPRRDPGHHHHHAITLPAITFKAQSNPHVSDEVHDHPNKQPGRDTQQSKDSDNQLEDEGFFYPSPAPEPVHSTKLPANGYYSSKNVNHNNNQQNSDIQRDPYSYFYPSIPSNHQAKMPGNMPKEAFNGVGYPPYRGPSVPNYVGHFNNEFNNQPTTHSNHPPYQPQSQPLPVNVNNPQQTPYSMPNQNSHYPDFYEQIYHNYAPKGKSTTAFSHTGQPNDYYTPQALLPSNNGSSDGPGLIQYQNQQSNINNLMSSIVRAKTQEKTNGPAVSHQMKQLLDSHSKDPQKSHSATVYQFFQSLLSTPAPSASRP